MKPTAIILLSCPDRQGIITEVTRFITDNRGNIVYLDQYVDRENGVLFMRIEWELEGFLIPREKIKEYVSTLFTQRFEMEFSIFFSDIKPRMAIFVSKQSHCLYDLLARYKAGEWNVEIPCIVSNHEDLREVADQFGIPYYVWSIKKDHSNKDEVEAADEDLVRFTDSTGRLKLVIAHDVLLSIEAQENYVSIRYLDGEMQKEYSLRQSMRGIEELMDKHGIIRCQRSYFVNPRHVKVLRRDKEGMIQAEMDIPNSKPVPVSPKYYEQLSKLL